MQRNLFLAVGFSAVFSLPPASLAQGTGSGARPEVVKLHPSLLRAAKAGAGPTAVLIGLRDGTPPPDALLEHPDPEGESDRRQHRLAAQRRLAEQMPPDQFQVRYYYENFSMMAGTATAAAIYELANRSDVGWVLRDEKRVIHQTVSPLPPQVLIKSDQANALGFTGRGQAVAVLDTGVDSTIRELGGAAFPNAKVVGGFNVPEPGAPPTDCEGHGTSVASIVASTAGVAPDAKIVAVRVFPACQGFTYDSLIIEGINYVISNRSTFGIGAMNLSLGGPASRDRLDLGYCDNLQPQYATAIDAATAAGIVVVISSGNEAQLNRLAAPACVSSAVSVGAVYSTEQREVRWGDFCRDRAIQPGDPVCFSNTTTSLSLLAPGALWNVPTAGGTTISFSGTSAAAPAVAGAVALVRSARPELSVSAVVGILRATGRRITDARNNVVTPLLDTLAAVQLAANTFGSFTGAPVSIPDGSSSATATATVAGFAGTLGSVQAWVEIDHPDPRELRVRLAGPDGTSVVLHDRTGLPQHPINAVYGKTDAATVPLTAFRGKQANGTWTLTVSDMISGQTGRIRNFSVALFPDHPIEPIPPGVNGRALSVVAHTVSPKLFQSDVRLYNPSSSPKNFALYYVGFGVGGSTAAKSTRTVAPGQVLALNDVVLSEFFNSDSTGQMTIVSDDTGFVVTGRAYTRGPNGAFSLFVPGPRTLSGLSFGGGQATVNGLLKNAQTYSNVGFTEVSGSPVTVVMDVWNADGNILASTTRSTEANNTLVVSDIISNRGLPPTSNVRVNFTVTSATGRILPFATVVDDATGAASFQAAANPASSAEDIIVAQASHVTGANGDLFKTNVNITNLGSQSVTVTVSLIPYLLKGTPNPPRVYTIAPGQTVEKLDILQGEFGLADPSAAGLRIHPMGTTPLLVSTRTFVSKFGGNLGFAIPGVPASSALGPGAVATAIHLDQTDAKSGSRASFGFTEIAGAGVTVRVTAKSGDTGATLGTKTYPVAANTSFQTSVTDILGAGATANNLYLQFVIDSGSGRVIPYAASVDNMSGQGIYVAAQ